MGGDTGGRGSNSVKHTNQNELQNACYVFEVEMSLSEKGRLCLEWTISTTDGKKYLVEEIDSYLVLCRGIYI